MKKFFLFSILVLAFVSCQEDVELNNPSFEGKKDGVFWRAVDYRASIAANGNLTIEAYSSNEIVTLLTTYAKPGTYVIGIDNTKTASYTYTMGKDVISYTTGKFVGEGEIVIKEYDAVNRTVTGTFKFNTENVDENSLEAPTVNFQYGHFYKIPISN